MKNFQTTRFKIVLIIVMLSLFLASITTISYAKNEDPPEEYRGDPLLQGSAVIQEASFGIAWGDPDGPHATYDWPYEVVQMGHVIQSYQNYASGIDSAYFHHGIDMIAADGTAVYSHSGGQIVNIENYRPGNDLYWEVAVLDIEGYVWQYHHIDQNSIPQNIYDKFAEWQADPINGGFVPSNTHIGDIVFWPVVSMGYRFNHIHLNILAEGDIYLDPLEFHTPLIDNQSPEILEIGLLDGDTIVAGNTASEGYGLYVRARDLFMSDVYYLPPYKTEFSIDGGDWITVWEFHDLPGGSSDTTYVNDFFVPVYTRGNYDYRDFYIDLGFTTEGQREFPLEIGEYTIQVRVWDYNGNSTTDSFTWSIMAQPDECVDLYSTADTFIQEAIPSNNWGGYQFVYARGDNPSQNYKPLNSLLKWDLSDIPEEVEVTTSDLTLRVTTASPDIYYLYKLNQDWVEGTFNGQESDISANWDTYNGTEGWGQAGAQNIPLDRDNLNLWNVTQTSYNQIGSRTISLNNDGLDVVQGWIDGTLENKGLTMQNIASRNPLVFASGEHTTYHAPVLRVCYNFPEPENHPPAAHSQEITIIKNSSAAITLTGSDIDADLLSYQVLHEPSHGDLICTKDDFEYTYTPKNDYVGWDNFSFIVDDGIHVSEPGVISIWVADPTSAQIIEFYATINLNSIDLFWETTPGYIFQGFNLYRATNIDNPKQKLNTDLIMPRDLSEEKFTYKDYDITPYLKYFYWLEKINLDGTTEEYGPVMANLFTIFLPIFTNN